MSSPVPGSTLNSASVLFSWNPAANVSGYGLCVGSTQGGYDLFAHSVGTSLSVQVSNLPIDGRQLWVRLWSQTGSTWLYSDQAYTAWNGAPTITSPAPGCSLTSSSVLFAWSPGAGASSYGLCVGSTAGGYGYYAQQLGNVLSCTVSNLPTDGRTIYVRLWYMVGSSWFSEDFTYVAR